MFDRQAGPALVTLCITLAACGVSFRYAARAAQAYFAKEPVPLRKPLTSIPRRLGDWQAVGDDIELTAEVEEALGTSKYLSRYYAAEGRDSGVAVHIAYYTGLIDAVPHVPDRCFAAGGLAAQGLPQNVDLPLDRSRWEADAGPVNQRTGEPYPLLRFAHHVTGRMTEVRMPLGETKLRITEFRAPDQPGQRIFAGYFFVANGQVTPAPEGVRRLAFDLTNRHAYYCKIQFTAALRGDEGRREFLDLVSDFAEELLPQVMLCLPDWAEVESASRS